LFELWRRPVTQRRVKPLLIVGLFHEVPNRRSGFRLVAILLPVDFLDFNVLINDSALALS
jgi:hypothetical protein